MQTKTAAKKTQTLEAGSDCLVSAAEAGGPADTGTNKMAAVCSKTAARSAQADKRQKAPICTGQQGAKYHREPGPPVSTGWVGPSRCQRPRERRATMAASQTGLPYCSDKRTGRRGGGRRTRGSSHTCSRPHSRTRRKTRRTKRGRDLRKKSGSEVAAKRGERRRSVRTHTHTQHVCLLLHSHMELRGVMAPT